MKENEMDIVIKKLSLATDDILVINIKDLNRLPKSKAEDYARSIKLHVEGIISNRVLVTCGDVELTKITRKEES
jgi:hypothetical protein